MVHPLILSLILTLLSASWESMSSKRPEPCLATKTWMSCCSRPVRLTGEVLRLRSSAWRPTHQFLVPPCWEQTSLTCWPYQEVLPLRGVHHWEPTLLSTGVEASYCTGHASFPGRIGAMSRTWPDLHAAPMLPVSPTVSPHPALPFLQAAWSTLRARAVLREQDSGPERILQLSGLLPVALELHIVVKPGFQSAVER